MNAVVENGRHKADLVWHVPGRRLNAAVVEVKTTRTWSHSGVAKDLHTLAAFLTAGDRAYERAALLMFGPEVAEGILSRVRNSVEPGDEVALRKAQLVWHPCPGRPGEDLGPIGW